MIHEEGEKMFNDSAIKKVSAYGTEAYSTALSETYYPVYIGSGKCVMSLDATGAQGLNNRVQKAFGGMPSAADMYTVGQAMVGDVLSEHNTIPYGFLDYAVSIDGKRFAAADIKENASVWKRVNNIFEAWVTTEYILDARVKIKFKTYIPYGSECVVYEIETESYNVMTGKTDAVYDIRFDFIFNLKTRDLRPVFDEVNYDGKIVTAKVRGHELYVKKICAESSCGAVEFEDKALKISFNLKARKNPEKGIIALSFDGKKHLANLQKEYEEHLGFWRGYYAQCAKADYGDVAAEFLYNNSLYLFRMGYEPEKGIPIGHPFYFPWCWQQCSFWDTQFVCDAMLRSGNIVDTEKFLCFLNKSVRKKGKAFPWMFIYDGTTFLDESRDNAPLCITAHAMTAIRAYECTRDVNLLRDKCYNIIKRCAETARDTLFKKRADGKWIITLPVSNDVVDDEGTEINQTFTTLWFATVIKKFVEYSKLLGENIDEVYEEIANNFYLEHDGEEYLNSAGVKAAEHGWASWVPFLPYPSEGADFLDKKLLDATLEKYTFAELYKLKQNSFQPWTDCIEAQAMHRVGKYERAHALMKKATEETFGDGYFCEIGPMQQTCGYPPYISAHGSYASCYLDTAVNFSIWEKKGSVFTALPAEYKSRSVTVEKILSAGGILLERGEYSPQCVMCRFKGNLDGYRVEIALPSSLLPENAKAEINGEYRVIRFGKRSVTVEFGKSENYEVRIAAKD